MTKHTAQDIRSQEAAHAQNEQQRLRAEFYERQVAREAAKAKPRKRKVAPKLPFPKQPQRRAR